MACMVQQQPCGSPPQGKHIHEFLTISQSVIDKNEKLSRHLPISTSLRQHRAIAVLAQRFQHAVDDARVIAVRSAFMQQDDGARLELVDDA